MTEQQPWRQLTTSMSSPPTKPIPTTTTTTSTTTTMAKNKQMSSHKEPPELRPERSETKQIEFGYLARDEMGGNFYG